jgi:cell division septation protein DedD
MKSERSLGFHGHRSLLALVLLLAVSAIPVVAQVSPHEILNPDLKALEQNYFQQLIGINQSISKIKFPFPFYLSRYVGLDPAKQAEADSRGLEFVRFQDRVILKVTGNYNAAYDTLRLTQNERAAATFRSIVLPVLQVVTAAVPEDLACDGIGFEISHHTRTNDRSYDFEGKETLVVVFDRAAAWAMSRAASDAERQEILNRSKVFVSGVDFGLSLTERDPLNVQTLARSIPAKPDATSSARSSTLASHSALLKPEVPSPVTASPVAASAPVAAPAPAKSAPTRGSEQAASPPATDPPPAAPALTQTDADRLDERYQAQLAALAREGAAKFHFVAYAPPAFVLFHDQIALQMTLKNSLQFGPAKGSIYKRAAQSFDLFLAPLLKDISERVSPDVEFQLFDFSVLNKLSPTAKETSEAIEFICPRKALKQFVNAEITNQQLLDQSIVLVNGVRVALNLQLVE